MSFMQPEIVKGDWYLVDGTQGIESFPADMFGPEEAAAAYSGDVWSVEFTHGYGARFSAPGYMDCTDWTVYATLEEAQAALNEESDDA